MGNYLAPATIGGKAYLAPAVAPQVVRGTTAVRFDFTASYEIEGTVLTPESSIVSVSISPKNFALKGNAPQRFDAVVVGNNNADLSVSWQTSAGTITTYGAFLAPPGELEEQRITVRATSVQDPSKWDETVVTVQALPKVENVSVTPSGVTMAGGSTFQFLATVTGTNEPSQSVTWSTTLGEISATGQVTAPNIISGNQVGTITATSVLDPTKSGSVQFAMQGTAIVPDPDPPDTDPEIEEPQYGVGLLSTYSQLQEQIKNWLHRKDLVARIPLFIALAEAKINRMAHVQAMQKEAVLVLEPGARSVALPASFMSPIAAWLEGDAPRMELTPRTPEDMPVTTQRGTPAYWCIDGADLAVQCPVDVRRRVTLRYRGGFALSPTSPSNLLLTKYPDLYLYGALLQAAQYIRDQESMNLWMVLYKQAELEVNRNESRARAMAPLRTELAGLCR